VIAVLYLLYPPELQDNCHCPDRFLTTLAHDSTVYMVVSGLFALNSLLNIAAVQAISETVRGGGKGWVRWTSVLAIIGLGVNALDQIRHGVRDPVQATACAQGDATAKAALTVPGALQGLDPQGLIRFTTVGLWLLVISLLALRGRVWPGLLAALGLVSALLYALGAVAQSVQSQMLVVVLAAVGAVILLPVFYIWLGLWLLRSG
jgi:hypothetical protein